MFILLSMIELILPNDNMKRYVNIVIGFMIIIVIITPFVRLINSNFNIEKEVFKNMIDNIEFQYQEDSNLKIVQEKQIKETYLNKLREDIKNTLDGTIDYDIYDINISIFEDEENYGNIKDIEIIMESTNNNLDHDQDSINTVKIEEIRINNLYSEEDEITELEGNENIKDILYEKYSVPKDNIKIYVKNN